MPTTYMLKCTLWDFLGFVRSEYDGQIIMGWIHHGRRYNLKSHLLRNFLSLCVLRFLFREKKDSYRMPSGHGSRIWIHFVDYYYFLVQVYLFYLVILLSAFYFEGVLVEAIINFYCVSSLSIYDKSFIFTKILLLDIHAPQPVVN